jgi:hypothetical protein
MAWVCRRHILSFPGAIFPQTLEGSSGKNGMM